MKKVSRLLVLILAVVMLLGVFAGCDGVIIKNTDKYRSVVAMKIGEESITVGRLIDAYNSYYNQYASYVSQGYISKDYLFEMTVSSLYTQYMKIDAYKNTPDVQKYTHTGTLALQDQEYVSDAELSYAVVYIKYVLFQTLDGVVEGYVKEEYTLNDAKEDDTSRDFAKPDDLGDSSSYSEYQYSKNVSSEEMDKYVSKYYAGLITDDNLNVDEYVYTSAEKAQPMIDSLNARLDNEEDEITFDQYVAWQNRALKLYKKNVVATYSYGLDKLLEKQANDFIASLIVAKYNYNVYKAIDGSDKATTVSDLSQAYSDLKKNQTSQFNIDKDFVSFIEGLSDSSYIYNVPDGYNYIYVKNILIPFNDAQKQILSNLQKQIGTTDDPRYTAMQLELASQIAAEDFNSDSDEKVEDIFVKSGDKIAINPDGALGKYFEDGKVKLADDYTSADEVVKALMLQYNTDTAQHSTLYDYVVRVGEVPSSYTAKWVPEFVTAANEAYDLATADGADAAGYYGLAISTYGVHIVYYSGDVEAQEFKFDDDSALLNTTTPTYRMYVTYYNTQSSKLLSDALKDLQKVYFDGKITKNKEFDKFVKSNGFEFDFEHSISLEEQH